MLALSQLVALRIQHALELAHHDNVELVDDLLLCGRFGWRRVCDDGGHFLLRAAPAEAAEKLGSGHDRLVTWRLKTEKPESR